MLKKSLKHFTQVLGAVLVGLLLVVLVFAWKLSQGPINMPLLTPYIVEGISKNTRGVRVTIDDTILTWQGWERTLDVRVLGMNFFTRDSRKLASIPEAAISLSGPAALKGVAAPRSLELIEPVVHLIRDKNGALAFEMGDGISVRADKAFDVNDWVSKQADPNRPLSYLERIVIERGEFDYTDRTTGASVTAPQTTIEIERIGENLVLDSDLNLLLGSEPTEVKLSASYNLTSQIFDAQADINALNVAEIASLIPELSQLSPLETTLGGKVLVAVDKDFHVRSFFVDLAANGGRLNLSQPLEQTLALDTVSVRAGYEDLNSKIRVEEFLLALPPGSMVQLPEPLRHAMPVETIRVHGDYDITEDMISLENLAIDLGEGPTAVVKGSVSGVMKGPNRKLEAVGEVFKVNPTNLHRYWPKGLNDDARDWVVDHLYDGIVHRAGIDISLTAGEDGEIELHHVHGDMEMEGVSVDYLRPMPTVKNAKGWAKFNHKEFNITVTGGGVGEIQVEKGQIDITGLDEYDQRLTLDLTAKGPLRDTLEFIDNEPLGFAKALGLDAAKTSGQTTTNLKMSFLLLDDLTWDGVDVSATAKGTDIRIKDVIFEEDLSDGAITLNVDKKGMDVAGKIVLGTIPADLKWRENFTKNTLFKRRFWLDGIVTDQQRVGELKLDFPPFNDDVMEGPIHVDASIVQNWDGYGYIETFADLEGAKVDVPVLHWKKTAQEGGQAYAKVMFGDERVLSVPYFSISSGDLKAAGSVTMNAKGDNFQLIRISRFEAGRTKVSGGTVIYSPQNGWNFDVHGESLDLTYLIQDLKNADRTKKAANDNEDTDLMGTFSGRFGKVWLDDNHSLDTVAGAISSDGKIWTAAHMTGVVGGGKPFLIDISPKDQNRALKMETKDAGALLRALDLFDDMAGGDLSIDGTLNDDVAGRPLVGTISIKGYRITKVPALAKLLSLAALTGVLDSLQGDGIGFTDLTSPFKYHSGVIELKDGRTNGISMGLTWEGKIYTHANVANIKGTIVPMYGLNSFLGNVPILGQLFTGGEKGGGLFAWTYTMTGDLNDPEVNINPVSALAPGVLRKIFQIGEEPVAEETPPATQ